jgi:hypothetical protein
LFRAPPDTFSLYERLSNANEMGLGKEALCKAGKPNLFVVFLYGAFPATFSYLFFWV